MTKILKNIIKCNSCGDVIESRNSHDYKVCSCGKCAVYGGLKELKRDYVFSPNDYTDLSETEEVADIDKGVLYDEEAEYRSTRNGNKRNKRRKGR